MSVHVNDNSEGRAHDWPRLRDDVWPVSDQQMSGGVTTCYVKIVNPSTQLQAARIWFTGVTSIDKTATQAVLTGNPGARTGSQPRTRSSRGRAA